MLTRLNFLIGHWLAAVTRRLRNNFYLFLAALLSVCILLDASVFHVGENMRQKTFDFMLRQRVVTPRPDPDIIIVDINEASLAALAGEYGRWPWPRQVLGEFLENIEQQRPRAVVFDILFSDADVYNPDSDAYFNDVIKTTANTFFPFLRLAETHDGLSKVKPDMIPGVIETAPGRGNPDATVAVVLPHFASMLASGRLGTHNIYPDADGIVREYRLWHVLDGWKLPSLPLKIAQQQGYATPAEQNVLLNWRGGPFTYQYVSFSDVYQDMGRKVKQRAQDEFTGKIVIIGSTAPSLFDIKATAMAKAHPGVEILATAIDNIRHDDYLRVWRGTLPYVTLSLVIMWLTAGAFYRNVDRERCNRLFSSSQAGLLAVSYAAINLTNTYIDLTGPVAWAVAYFSIAKIYALATDRAMQHWLAHDVQPGNSGVHVLLMPMLIETVEPLGDAVLKKLRREIESAGSLPPQVVTLRGAQSGIWGLLSDMLLLSWNCAPENEEQHVQIRQEAERMALAFAAIRNRIGLPANTSMRYVLHEGTLNSRQPLAPQWRILFAQAVLKLEKTPSP